MLELELLVLLLELVVVAALVEALVAARPAPVLAELELAPSTLCSAVNSDRRSLLSWATPLDQGEVGGPLADEPVPEVELADAVADVELALETEFDASDAAAMSARSICACDEPLTDPIDIACALNLAELRLH